ncbi:Hint domain-containing protein [Gluconacetobacter sp.]|uniref:Hint domain-containing protein n=1 Tax=Gluconacetobacter sp. TaxID=1935994 RepID=UPI0039E888E8
MSSAGTYYTYDAQGHIETTWTITDGTLFNGGIGNSNITITDSNGNTIKTLTGVPDGLLSHIQTGTDATNGSLLSIIGGQWVSVPGSSGTIDIVLSALSAPVFTIGGTTDIDFVVNAATAITMNIYGGTATFSGGLIAGALSGSTINIGYGGTYNGNTQLISLLQGTTINFTTGGGTLVLNGGGVFLNLSGTSITGYDPQYDTIEIKNTVATVSGYTIATSGTNKTITLFGSDGTQIATYTVTPAANANLPVGTYNNLATEDVNTNPLQITYKDHNTYIGACFLAGSMIRTPDGDCAVEDIRIGDEISVYDWRNNIEATRDVVWVGSRKVVVRPDYPDDEAGYPVRILKDAVADGVPYKDMLITAEHCLFFANSFIPARMLVNGTSIFYDKSITSYTYYHIETDPHAVIRADGMLTESYLDTGNRRAFQQDGKVATLRGVVRTWEEDAGAPLNVARAFAEPLFRQLASRAEAAHLESQAPAPVLTDEPDLHLTTDKGQILRKIREADGCTLFMVPTGVRTVRLVSRASRPSDTIGPFVDDRRPFGIEVGEIRLFEGNHARTITDHLTDGDLPGWHAVEGEYSRWTSGNASLPLGERHPNSIAMLAITVRSAGPYIASDETTRALTSSL